jgi:hypothetical protein
MMGALMLETNYFVDDTTHTNKEFQHLFRVNKEMFMRTVYGVMEYDDYFMCKEPSLFHVD